MKNTVKIEHNGVKFVAHRGLSGLEKENTAAAFIAAGNRESYFGIETDVHPTKDGKFVISHDGDIKRTGGIDLNLEKTNLEESQTHVLTNWFGNAPRTDLRVPALEDYLEICEKYGKVAVLELKYDFNKEQLIKMAEIIKAYNMLENTVFISFIDSVLVRLREILPDQQMQFLACEVNNKTVNFLQKYNFGLDIMQSGLSKEWIDILKGKKIEINIWTVDNPETAKQYIEWGVDYITTNILE